MCNGKAARLDKYGLCMATSPSDVVHVKSFHGIKCSCQNQPTSFLQADFDGRYMQIRKVV